MNFPRSDSPALHIPLGASDPWRVVQGPTDLWYWDRLERTRTRQIGILNAFQLSTWKAPGHPSPDANQSVVQGLGGHRGLSSDEALQEVLPQKRPLLPHDVWLKRLVNEAP